MKGDIKIETSWAKGLAGEFEKPYFASLTAFVRAEYLKHKVYPPPKDIFRAFDLCPFENVRVVILGQDPYHGAGQANGLCFAVGSGVRLPPSLVNIFKELTSDLGLPELAPQSLGDVGKQGDLSRWASEGVLLLNATLTVQSSSPGSHQGRGWEQFTDAVIAKLSQEREHLVFILWGNCARAKGDHIDRSKHLVIESAHPSPFSVRNGFFGSKPFSRTNTYLLAHNISPIDWR